MTELSEAVSALVDIRPVITRQEAGEAHEGGVHVETLPSLLRLLVDGTGSAMSGSGSSGSGVPIDADALELWAQIAERVCEWARIAGTGFWRGHLAESIRVWAERFDALHNAHIVDDDAYLERVRWFDTWCARIEAKFDPDEKREATTPCPRCGLLKIKSDDLDEPEQFAIELNITKNLASCRNPVCGYQQRIPEWRFESNIAAMSELDSVALSVLVARDTTNANM